jgi:hypothetical protein
VQSKTAQWLKLNNSEGFKMNIQMYQWRLIGVLALALMTNLAHAENAPSAEAKTLLYISPADYQYSVRLLHPYYDYWFTQGPLVEPIALQALQDKSADVAMCKANEVANTIVRIKPSLFYNPQSRVFYSKLEATVYGGGGELKGQYVGEAQQQGLTSVDNATQFYLKKAYSLAMQNLMSKLPIDQLGQTASAVNKLPCGMIGGQQEPKIGYY